MVVRPGDYADDAWLKCPVSHEQAAAELAGRLHKPVSPFRQMEADQRL